MIALFVIPVLTLFVGIYLVSQLLIVIPLFVIALLALYMVKLVALVPIIVLIFASFLFFGRKKTCKRCSKPEEKCDMCGK